MAHICPAGCCTWGGLSGKDCYVPINFCFPWYHSLFACDLRRASKLVPIALVSFLLVAGPYVAILSSVKGSLTYGDIGKLMYAWYVNSVLSIGDGLIEAKVNRIELKKLRPQNSLVVIRYRYHPSWRATPHIPVFSYPIPEDPSGFIALKEPGESVTLWFDPLALMAKPWPKKLNTVGPIPAKQNQASNTVDESLRAH
jgi:hypothetical protein